MCTFKENEKKLIIQSACHSARQSAILNFFFFLTSVNQNSPKLEGIKTY